MSHQYQAAIILDVFFDHNFRLKINVLSLNPKRYFILNKLYIYIVRIKFIYYKLKYFINFILQYLNQYKLLY